MSNVDGGRLPGGPQVRALTVLLELGKDTPLWCLGKRWQDSQVVLAPEGVMPLGAFTLERLGLTVNPATAS